MLRNASMTKQGLGGAESLAIIIIGDEDEEEEWVERS